ncbi:MAG: TolB family protein [Gemmatimonadota bacterium]
MSRTAPGAPRHVLGFSLLTGVVLLGSACSSALSPLKNKIKVGEEDFAVFAADGPGGQSDLFAVLAAGGSVHQLTFTQLAEDAPALSPDGGGVAFLRARAGADSGSRRVWVMNLLNGAERELPLPDGAGAPSEVAWSRDGRSIYVRTDAGLYRVAAPPADPAPARVSGTDSLAADSALALVLGDPPLARVTPCPAGVAGICVTTVTGETQVLEKEGRDPTRWGPDSLGFFVGDGNDFEVRPLGGGRSRRLLWKRVPNGAHHMTYARALPRPREQ